MRRKYADALAALLLGAVLLTGGTATWQAYQQWTATDGMGGHMATMHGTHPAWYLLGTILVAVVVAGVYVSVREEITDSSADSAPGETADRTSETRSRSNGDHKSGTPDGEPVPSTQGTDDTSTQDANATPDRQVLDLLPEDERRVLRPVLDSPGLTQIELRDRSEFSKSKVSQTVTDLEKRGLLYREPQGRTYRIYPDDDIEETLER